MVSIIGLLAVIALPAAIKARMRSLNTRFVNDLRQIEQQAFTYYAFEHGGYPPEAAAGVLPKGIEPLLPRHVDWAEPTAIGGLWDWERGPTAHSKVHGICHAGLAVFKPNRTEAELRDIDTMIDDGNLDTGAFRKTPTGCIYILEP